MDEAAVDLQFRVQNAKPAALPAPPRTAVERKVRIMPIASSWRDKLIVGGEKKLGEDLAAMGEVLVIRQKWRDTRLIGE